MDDGLVLRADVYRPDADGRYPVLLSYGPYGKGLPFQEGYPTPGRSWPATTPTSPRVPPTASRTGRSPTRRSGCPTATSASASTPAGAGRSPGRMDLGRPRETRDFYDCIEWAGTQPWSNGKVGLNGISYYAMNQWQVAARQPPHLAAICVWEGASRLYRDMTTTAGSSAPSCQLDPRCRSTRCSTAAASDGPRHPEHRPAGVRRRAPDRRGAGGRT